MFIEKRGESENWFFFSSRRRHTIWTGDWSSDVCSSDLDVAEHDVTDVVRAHARAADGLADHLGGQVTGRDGGEAATVLADRGPDGGYDEYVFHDSFSHLPKPPFTAQICPVMYDDASWAMNATTRAVAVRSRSSSLRSYLFALVTLSLLCPAVMVNRYGIGGGHRGTVC